MIYPSEFQACKENFAEQAVFKGLLKLGMDDFDIFYNKSFAGKPPAESLHYEIDFLLFDLRGGKLNHIFIIEVKGGTINYNGKRNQWVTNGKALSKGPDEQAMGYVSNILERYKAELLNKVPVTWLLLFLDGVKGMNYLPSHLDRWRVLDQSALQNPLKFLEKAIKQQVFTGRTFSGAELEDYEEEIQTDLLQDLHISLKNLLAEMNIQFDQIETAERLNNKKNNLNQNNL